MSRFELNHVVVPRAHRRRVIDTLRFLYPGVWRYERRGDVSVWTFEDGGEVMGESRCVGDDDQFLVSYRWMSGPRDGESINGLYRPPFRLVVDQRLA